MKQSVFFGTQIVPPSDSPESPLTKCYVPERTEDGVVFSLKVLELQDNPQAVLNFRDFTVNNLLAAGINPLSLKIKLESNQKIGKDSEIAKFNALMDEKAEQLFNN